MKILYIWDADYPWDIRVEKICKSLNEYGHEVHIAARNLKRLPEFERIDDLNIHRLRSFTNDRVNHTLSFPFFFSPVWKRFLDKIIISNDIDLIMVRDLPMVIAGILAGRRYKLPVIFDMAENYVAMVYNFWKYRKFEALNIVVRNPYFASIVERYALKKVDHIFVVVEEAKQYALNKGANSERISILSNTPSLKLFQMKTNENSDKINMIKNKYSVLYVGGIQMGRGIQLVLKAIPKIVEKIPDFLFVVIGDGYATPKIKEIMFETRVQNYVLWVGWVDHKQISGYIQSSKVGIIPHVVSAHTDTTVPNKLFDYMGFGLPVLASDAVPLKRILTEENCGVVFKSGNVDDLAEKLLTIYHSQTDYSNYGKNAVAGKYNWDKESKHLQEVISRFKKQE